MSHTTTHSRSRTFRPGTSGARRASGLQALRSRSRAQRSYPHSPRRSRTLQFGAIVPGAFAPVLAKHSKSISLVDAITVGVDRMKRYFEPMRNRWRLGGKLSSATSPPRSSSTGPSSKANWTCSSTWLGAFMTLTLANRVEHIKRFHIGLQGTGSDSTLQGEGPARQVPG